MCETRRVGKRQESRQRIEAQIVELGRRQLATVGAAGLSVRAIARDLGMVSSAVYRYVASRDALLTLLLVDAYSDLADTVGQARAGTDGGWRADVATIAHALRQWAAGSAGRAGRCCTAARCPAITPRPKLTTGPGTRVIGMLFDAVATGVATGDIALTEHHVAQPMSTDLVRVRDEFGFPGDDALVIQVHRGLGADHRRRQPRDLRSVRHRHLQRSTSGRCSTNRSALAIDLLTAGPQN